MHGQCHFIPLALLLALLISQAVSWLGPPDLDADTTVAPDSDAFEGLFDKLVANYLDGDGSIPKVSHAKARVKVKRNDTSSEETGLQVSNRASSIAGEPHVSSEQPPAVLDHASAAIDRHLRRFDARQAQARAVAFQRRAFELQMQQHVQLQRMMAGVFALSTLFGDDEYDYLGPPSALHFFLLSHPPQQFATHPILRDIQALQNGCWPGCSFLVQQHTQQLRPQQEPLRTVVPRLASFY